MDNIYIVKPYNVGSKYSKSLAVILPKKVTTECNIDQSTVFVLTIDKYKKILILKPINPLVKSLEEVSRY